MAPSTLFSVFFALACFAYGCFFLKVMSDWPGFVIREGYTTYGAERIRAGDWPYRDFFFLWTPGVLALHAFLQELGASAAVERGASLLAAVGSAALIFHEARRWHLNRRERGYLMALLFLWSFPLWNIPYSSWYAVFFALLALRWRSRSWLGVGLLMGLSFWFKQNIGLFAAAGTLFSLVAWRQWRSLLYFFPALLVAVALPFLPLWFFAGDLWLHAAIRQIFLFPLQYPALMGRGLPAFAIGSPLITIGLWLCSLYLSKASALPRNLARAVAVAHASYSVAMEGREYFAGIFLLLSMVAWVGSFAFLTQEKKIERDAIWFLWFPCFGIFLQIYPRADFAHFLFVFPLSAAFLIWFLGRIPRRYPAVPAAWAFFPALLLVFGGALFQGRAAFTRYYGAEDTAGFYSYGESYRLDEEMGAVSRYLRDQGLKDHDPILVLPSATTFYRFAKLRNPTPHNQFFPGYVEAYGAKPEEVLASFEKAGGRFVVLQHGSELAQMAPIIDQQLKKTYGEQKHFPYHFSVWRKLE
ncbi:MAG: hypothetical protein EOP11_06335 [Proteobacteria bacterium]|nr:MAG: hypothetical protein EOP11_06335 [Pseudomonadota bacterium]